MSDRRLRELERVFKETSSLEDELAWLRARLKTAESIDSFLPDCESFYNRFPQSSPIDDYLRANYVSFMHLDDENFQMAMRCIAGLRRLGNYAALEEFSKTE